MPAGKARSPASLKPRSTPWRNSAPAASASAPRSVPASAANSYEVGPEFPAPFLKRDEADAAFFRTAPRAGHFLFDLAGYLVRRIGQAGVAVEATGHDTLAGDADFFSYRRNTLKGVRDYGRSLSAIALED